MHVSAGGQTSNDKKLLTSTWGQKQHSYGFDCSINEKRNSYIYIYVYIYIYIYIFICIYLYVYMINKFSLFKLFSKYASVRMESPKWTDLWRGGGGGGASQA